MNRSRDEAKARDKRPVSSNRTSTLSLSSMDSAPSLEPDSASSGVNETEGNARFEAATRPPRHSRNRFPPLSFSKYKHYGLQLRNPPPAPGTIEALDAIKRASTSIHGHGSEHHEDDSYSSSESDCSGSDIPPISASAPDLLATSGSRRRGPTETEDEAGLHRSSTAPQPRPQLPPLQTGLLPPPSMHSERRLSRTPAAMHFAAFCAMAPQIPQHKRAHVVDFTQSPPPVPEHRHVKNTNDNKDEGGRIENDPSPPSPILQASEGAYTLSLRSPPIPDSPQPDHVRRQSVEKAKGFERQATSPQVVRGHGTGFEILARGSLDSPQRTELQHGRINEATASTPRPAGPRKLRESRGSRG